MLATEPHPRIPLLVRKRIIVAWLFFLIVLPLVLFTAHRWPEESFLDLGLDTLGYGFIVLGILTRLWATLYIGGRKNGSVQQTGPYSLVRHPLYLGTFAIGIGFSALSENPVVLLVVLGYLFVQYWFTIRHEEQVLTGLFGDAYLAYRQRVPCIFPRLKTFDPTPPESINLKPLRKEVVSAVAVLCIVPFLELITLLHQKGLLPIFQLHLW